ncbi:MAG: hypothetical protein J2P54_08230 [Bradyrhizobiaceae bacterium]|nr:hypothetical protein [Bradyrhizobiaceae bacterium]
MRWKRKSEPADVELTLVRERNSPVWFKYVAMMLFSALNRADLKLLEPLRSAD